MAESKTKFRKIRRSFSRNSHGKRRFSIEPLERRSLLSATPAGDEFLINTPVVRTLANLGETADVAVSADGSFVATYSGHGPGDRQGVFAQRFESDGSKLGELFLVNYRQNGDQHSSQIDSDDDGNFLVVWSGRGSGDHDGVFAQWFDEAGDRVGTETLVSSTTDGRQHMPSVAMAPDGRSVVAWSGNGPDDISGVFFQLFDAAGSAVGDESRINSTTENHQVDPAVAMDANGNFVVTWSSRHEDGSDWGIFARQFDSNGTAKSDAVRVNTETENSQYQSDVSANASGQFAVTWSSLTDDDGWEVMGQRFDTDGSTQGDEFLVNGESAGHQMDSHVTAFSGGFFTTWNSAVDDGTGWESFGRTYEPGGDADGDVFQINSVTPGANSGHQQTHAVTVNQSGDAIAIWRGHGSGDRRGVYAQRYSLDGGINLTPDLTSIDDTQGILGSELTLSVTATDPNAGDQLTFQLDSDSSPDDAVLEQIDNNTATIRWTPGSDDLPGPVDFRVIVTDDGDPVLTDSETFSVNVVVDPPSVDLNGDDESGIDFTATFDPNVGSVSVVDSDMAVDDPDDTQLVSGTATLAENPDGILESLSVDTIGTSLVSSYDAIAGELSLDGTDSLANWQTVLATLQYSNSATTPTGQTRSIEVIVSDGKGTSESATATVDIPSDNNPPSANDDSFTVPENSEATELDVLANDSTSPDEGEILTILSTSVSSNGGAVVIGNGDTIIQYRPPVDFVGIDTFTYTVEDGNGGTDQATVRINVSDQNAAPSFATIADVTLLSGSPLHIPLDGIDPDGDSLTFSATSDNSLVDTFIPQGNRSMRIGVSSPGNNLSGDMVFELYEQRAPRVTSQIIELASSGDYNGVRFHRIASPGSPFVIQGGDITNGDGTGGSHLGDFDDQYHVDLQHNRIGVLSMAKTSDDTNDSQFFITARATRNLDFQHSIFGQLVEGEDVRSAVQAVPVGAGDTPIDTVLMETVEIFFDNENAILMLKADEGLSGSATITVTVEDPFGEQFVQAFDVTVTPDTVPNASNGGPFLEDIPVVEIIEGNPIEFLVVAVDAENDPFTFDVDTVSSSDSQIDDISVTNDGLVQVTPIDSFTTGILEIFVTVFPDELSDTNGGSDDQVVTIDVLPASSVL